MDLNSFQCFFDSIENNKRFSQNTILAYRTDCKEFLLENKLETIESLSCFTYNNLRTWFGGLLDQGLSAKTVRRKMSACRHLFAFFHRNKFISKNPMEKILPPKLSKRLPSFFDEEHLITAIENRFSAPMGDSYAEIRNRTIIELLYATGIRRGELVGLKVSDYDSANKHLRILGKGNKERIIPIVSQMASVLEEYLSYREMIVTNHNALFLTVKFLPIYPRLVHSIVVDFFKSSSVVNGQKSPHTFRHSFATHLLNHGAPLNDIKTLLGHSDLTATQIYTHTSLERLKSLHKKLHPRG